MTQPARNRILRSGPARRQVVLAEEDAPPPDDLRPLIRNHHTLIYPGRDLELQADSEETEVWHDLGCLAIGRVESAAAPPAPPQGTMILWNGPHADFALFDPSMHTAVPLEADPPSPDLLLAGILAEAECSLSGADEANPSEGEFSGARYAVLGQGLLGHLAAQHLRLAGAIVTVIENSPKRLEFSKYLGLTDRIDLHNLQWESKLRRSHPDGLDGFIDATGAPGPALEVLRHVRPGGRFGLVGPWRPRLGAPDLPPEFKTFCETNKIQVTPPGPRFGECRQTSERHRESALGWTGGIQSGEPRTDRLITKRITPAEAPMDLKRLVAGVRSILGVIITWPDRES